uniref:Glycosyltransferase n=1 Tax=Dictyoglomus thermophilum TaxID=14 RepID=A0A7C3MJK1_DICTH
MLNVDILGIKFTSLEDDEFKKLILSFMESNKCNTIFTPNAEMLVIANENPEFKKVLYESDLNIPDGIGITLLAKRKGYFIRKFPGIEAMEKILSWAEIYGFPIFFLGAKEEVVRKLVENLKLKYPDLLVAGFRNGYFSDEEEEKIIKMINESGAKILFVALGAPKQEFFISKYKRDLKVRVAMGVGGSFDVLSGVKRRAPWIFRKLGLEWFYRILQEPKRIFVRFPRLLRFLRIYTKG